MFDIKGQRKYLTRAERLAFLKASASFCPEHRTFCYVLAYTGARISEVLALTPAQIDLVENLIIIESLKKRRNGIYRAVPVPQQVIALLESTHRISDLQTCKVATATRIWPWSRTTGWITVKKVLQCAGVPEFVAMPKALRHGMGIACVQAGVPLNLLQKWLGHAQLSTTTIYTSAIGEEELAIAERLWRITEP